MGFASVKIAGVIPIKMPSCSQARTPSLPSSMQLVFEILTAPLMGVVVILTKEAVSSVAISSLSLLMSVALSSDLGIISFSVKEATALSVSIGMPLTACFSVILAAYSTYTKMVLVSSPTTSGALLVSSSATSLLKAFSPSTFSNTTSATFSIKASVSALPPVGALSSSFNFSMSNFDVEIALAIILSA